MDSQIACTETSAFDGGSQPPTPSRSLHNPGSGTRNTWLETYVSAITARAIAAVLRTITVNFRGRSNELRSTESYHNSVQHPDLIPISLNRIETFSVALRSGNDLLSESPVVGGGAQSTTVSTTC